MFENRIKLLLILFVLPALVVAARLVQLQVFDKAVYVAATDKMLKTEPRQYPCLRGSVLDRIETPLAYDSPAWDIAVHYGVMVDVPAVRKRMCKTIGISLRDLTPERIDESWLRLCQITDCPLLELKDSAQRIVARVQKIKARVTEKWGVEKLILEEIQPHAVVKGLNQAQQVAARVALSEYPWIEVVAGHCRKYDGGAAIGHILGQLSRVTDDALATDPNADDPLDLAGYTADDYFGVRGVEALGEQWLRGKRGLVNEDRKGNREEIDAVNGRDVRLSIDRGLQQALYAQLGREITERVPSSPGGCAILLDIPTRQVIAMVSYPSVDPNNPAEVMAARDDLVRKPFLFRAVREHYPPGSIVKPMLLAGALSRGTIGPNETVVCNGRLFADQPNQWGCTGVHGPMEPIAAIQHSCNIFFYSLGQRMGVDDEAYWMRQFGLGQLSGTGLLDELKGNLPKTRGNGQARQAAIGQSEVAITPIQAANMTATLASGVYQPVTLWPDNPAARPAPITLPVSPAVWRIVREGMYRVVNVERGTAHRTTQLKNGGPYVLLGKTGSAEVRKDQPTHSWFIGYLAPRNRYTESVPAGPASVAITVVVEYAGHGGEVAAPIAGAMLDAYLMELSRPSAGEPAALTPGTAGAKDGGGQQ